MKKYILLLVTALLLTGLAGCSMTKNRYNHYGVVKYLENKYDDKFEYYETLIKDIGWGNHAFIAHSDVGFHDTVRFIVIWSRPPCGYGQYKNVLTIFSFRSKDKTRIGRNSLFDQAADHLCIGLSI